MKGWGRFIYPTRNLYPLLSIDLRSGTALLVSWLIHSAAAPHYHARCTQIPTLRPLSGSAHPPSPLHQQRLALPALRGGAPMSCKDCERALKMIELYLQVHGNSHIDYRSLLEDIRIILRGEEVTSFRRLAL